ncbi:transposase [Micromonospora craniellae]|uniref:transposase n=1 Tax=Micromonospora craniellae TaxID=2294034 RepID=UPI0018F1A79F|nr:transposase [Micromonospora craniellae]
MAVTRTGIPVRVWCWPGNTGDSALIRQVKTDMREWNFARVVWVADRGFASAENRRFLQQGAGGYILGEKLRRHRRGRRRPGPTGPLRHRRRQPAGQGSQHRRRRPVRDLPQPRSHPT